MFVMWLEVTGHVLRPICGHYVTPTLFFKDSFQFLLNFIHGCIKLLTYFNINDDNTKISLQKDGST